MQFVGRLLSAGLSDATPERLARHIRVTNALALVGMVLSLASAPIDVISRVWAVVITDVLGGAMFAACPLLNARGRYLAARISFGLAANLVMLVGVLGAGAAPELRAVFFPLALLPFLIFSLRERGWLAVFVSLPVIGYFATSFAPQHAPESALAVYLVYAPALSFALIIGGSLIFAYVERSANERLAQTQAKAAQATRLVALGEMASGIAHEIRNPLSAIQLAASHIVEQPNDPALVAQLGERIQRIVGRTDRIIDTLRSFSRDASGDPFADKPVERIVGEALELCGKRFADSGVALEVPAISPDLVIECRSVQLSQVLVNLLSNAYDAVAMMPSPWVKIDVATEDASITIAVTDSGAGIPTELRQRLFEPFFTTKGPDRGTGLGLSLSRSIVVAHHGMLELDDRAPNTRFVLRVPRAQRQEQ